MMMEQSLLGSVGPLTQWVKSKAYSAPKGTFLVVTTGRHAICMETRGAAKQPTLCRIRSPHHYKA